MLYVPSLCTIDLYGVTEQDELPLPTAVAESGIGKSCMQIKFSQMYAIHSGMIVNPCGV